jgi:hypothetical protein
MLFPSVLSSRDWGYCLNDEPAEHKFNFPVLPPGVMYDIDHQCRLQYGPEAEFCDGIDVGLSVVVVAITVFRNGDY